MMDVRINIPNGTVIATGHANAERNDDGRDLVCCAASALIQALVVSCKQMSSVVVKDSISPGDVYIHISASEEQREGVASRMQMLLDAMTVLAAQYPMCIAIK